MIGVVRKWLTRRRRPIPEPRYAIVTGRGESRDPELLMGDTPVTGAGLNVAIGVIYSSLESALGDIRRNGMPTREAPLEDGTWCAVRDTKTGTILYP